MMFAYSWNLFIGMGLGFTSKALLQKTTTLLAGTCSLGWAWDYPENASIIDPQEQQSDYYSWYVVCACPSASASNVTLLDLMFVHTLAVGLKQIFFVLIIQYVHILLELKFIHNV